MKASHVWFGALLVVVGACGILDAAGLIDSSRTIGQWWPVAIIGWAIVDMLAAGRVTLGGSIWVAVGITLLADAQAWAGDVLIWSALALFAGLAIIVAESLKRGSAHGSRDRAAAATAEPSR